MTKAQLLKNADTQQRLAARSTHYVACFEAPYDQQLWRDLTDKLDNIDGYEYVVEGVFLFPIGYKLDHAKFPQFTITEFHPAAKKAAHPVKAHTRKIGKRVVSVKAHKKGIAIAS